MKKIILIGFFSEVVELCEENGYEILGYVDNATNNSRYCYLGNDEDFLANKDVYINYHLFLVPDAPRLRKKLYDLYHSYGFKFETIISDKAYISKTAEIAEGCMIQTGCNISSNVKLGICVRVNSLANIMHDTKVGNFSVVAPSSVLLGRVNVESCVYIGSNSTILPDITICDNNIVGAGAVLTKNVIEKDVVMVGVPARIMNKNVQK